MSAEINISTVLTFAKSGIAGGINLAFTPTWAGAKYNRTVQALSTVEEAINLGEATGGGGIAALVNRDTTNNIHIRQASGVANFMTLLPGEGFVFRWSTAATAPFAIASAGTPSLEVITLVA